MVWNRKKKAKKAKKAVSQVESSLDKALSNVRPLVTEGAKEAKDRATDLYENLSPAVKDAVQKQSDKVNELASKVTPQAQKLREDLEHDYLPRAKKTYGATESTVTAAVNAAVDAARKEWDKGYKDIQAAAVTPTKKKKRGGRVFLFLLLSLVGAGAGYVAWKRSRPVEDPWAPPADFARSHYPAAGNDEKEAEEVADSVAGAEAGDVADALKKDDEPKQNTHKKG